MNVVLWILQGVLAALFLAVGLMKLLQPADRLAEKGMGWVEDFPAGMAKVIGLLEALAAFGLVLPAVLKIAPVLVPLAATGLVLMMIGAAVTHARRGERQMIAMPAILLIVAAVVAWGRFGPYAF